MGWLSENTPASADGFCAAEEGVEAGEDGEDGAGDERTAATRARSLCCPFRSRRRASTRARVSGRVSCLLAGPTRALLWALSCSFCVTVSHNLYFQFKRNASIVENAIPRQGDQAQHIAAAGIPQVDNVVGVV